MLKIALKSWTGNGNKNEKESLASSSDGSFESKNAEFNPKSRASEQGEVRIAQSPGGSCGTGAELPSSGHRVPSNPRGAREPGRNLALLKALQVPWESTHGNTSRVIPPYCGKTEASPGQRSDVRSIRLLVAVLDTQRPEKYPLGSLEDGGRLGLAALPRDPPATLVAPLPQGDPLSILLCCFGGLEKQKLVRISRFFPLEMEFLRELFRLSGRAQGCAVGYLYSWPSSCLCAVFPEV